MSWFGSLVQSINAAQRSAHPFTTRAFPPNGLHTWEDSGSSVFLDDKKKVIEKMDTYSKLVRQTARASSCATT
jgi:hypothetical protein